MSKTKQVVTHFTKADLDEIKTTISNALKSSQYKGVEKSYVDLLEKVVDVLNELRLTVEFDHEERLRAIEEFLQEK